MTQKLWCVTTIRNGFTLYLTLREVTMASQAIRFSPLKRDAFVLGCYMTAEEWMEYLQPVIPKEQFALMTITEFVDNGDLNG